MIIIDVIIIVFLFSLFAFSHTILASNKIKKTIAEKLGVRIAFYRLFYNLSSLIFFIAFYTLAPKPDIVVYDLQFPFDIFVFALQVLSLAGLIWAVKSIKLKEFVGIAQLKRLMDGQYDISDMDEKQNFKIEGAYKFVRHPIYLFSILFLTFRPTMSLFYSVMLICIIVYFYVGSFYEERKLVDKFGDEYLLYQKKIPRIFPF
jgi:protein-S-isoprenylcysteine O-methyltransferase Ste14